MEEKGKETNEKERMGKKRRKLDIRKGMERGGTEREKINGRKGKKDIVTNNKGRNK